MKAIDKTIEELKNLDPDEALNVFNFVLSLKDKSRKPIDQEPSPEGYLGVRDALKNCSGSLSEDIVEERSDRL